MITWPVGRQCRQVTVEPSSHQQSVASGPAPPVTQDLPLRFHAGSSDGRGLGRNWLVFDREAGSGYVSRHPLPVGIWQVVVNSDGPLKAFGTALVTVEGGSRRRDRPGSARSGEGPRSGIPGPLRVGGALTLAAVGLMILGRVRDRRPTLTGAASVPQRRRVPVLTAGLARAVPRLHRRHWHRR